MVSNFDRDPAILIERRHGTPESPYVDMNETLTINTEGKTILSEIPLKYDRVRCYNVQTPELSEEWYEIEDGIPSPTQFKVDYVNKIATFHISHVGKQINAIYTGTGNHYYSISTIYTEQNNGKVTETLGDLTAGASEALKSEKERKENELIRINDENTRKANEDARILAESERVTIDSARNLNEIAREESESLRKSSETQRELDEASRKSAESQRVIEEGVRATAEGLRNSSESTRNNNEDARVLAETERKDSEIARTAKETNRDLAESSRKTNETARKTAETNRDLAETARENKEQTRISNESAREVSETNRDSAEIGRISAEEARTLAESTRTSNEDARVLAEDKRVLDTAEALSKVNTASESAQKIIDNDRWAGEYSPDVQYYKNNSVGLNGSSYIALQDTLGNSPTDPDSLYWALSAQRGVDGTGSVSSVNGTFPDESGNVTLSVPEGHTHTNKAVLDKLSDTAGTLQYNGQDVGSVVSVNGQKGEVTGLETVIGAQEKATLAETNSKSYTDEKVVDLTVFEAKEEFIATEGQTVFTLVGEYEVGKNRISTIVGGVPQYDSFTETSNKTITFSEAVPTGVDVVITYFKALPVGDGLVTSVNGVIPDPVGNVTIDIPEPDLSGFATKAELAELEGTKGQPNGIATLGLDGKVPNEQLPKISSSAVDVSITDTGNYFTGTNIEEALQEIGQAMNAMRGNLIASINGILQS